MRVSRFSRKLHDPWGNKFADDVGAIIKRQVLVGKTQVRTGSGCINSGIYELDAVHAIEGTWRKYVHGGKNSTEKLRR